MPALMRLTTLAALLASNTAALAATTVTYAPADQMTDVPRWATDRESMETSFREHLDKLAAKLPAGQDLKVEFLDIDLAGDEFPRVPVRDIRVMKGRADWPRLHVRYSIEQDGQVLRSGEDKLADPNYLMGSNWYDHELYGHEKQMLDEWFKKKVLAPE